jgi:hypothetical protein
MAQGDGSQYPILPISFSIIVFCCLFSAIIAILVDYLYDFYLIKYAKLEEKSLIEQRVKNDLKRMKIFFKPSKLEKFDCDEAKNRLTIIKKLVTEKLTSTETTSIKEIKTNQNKIEGAKTIDNNEPHSSIKKAEKHKLADPSQKQEPKPIERTEKTTKENKNDAENKHTVQEGFEKMIQPSREKSKTNLFIERSKPVSATRPASSKRPITSRSIVK